MIKYCIMLLFLSSCVHSGDPWSEKEFEGELGDKIPVSETPNIKQDFSGAWWEVFKSSELDIFVGKVLKNDLDLKVKLLNIEKQMLANDVVLSSLWPSVGLDVKGSRQKVVAENPMGDVVSSHSNRFSAGLNLNYQLDIFGEVSHQVSASEWQIVALIEEYRAALYQTVFEAVSLWFDLWLVERKLEIVQKNIEIEKKNLELISEHFRLGIANAFQVHSAKVQLDSVENEVYPLISEKNRLNIEMRKTLGEQYKKVLVFKFSQVPENLKKTVGAFSAKDIVSRSPMVKAALARSRAAHYASASALAARFPRFSFSASLSHQAESLQDLLSPEELAWNLLGNITMPLFDAGRRKNQWLQKKKELEAAILSYKSVAIKTLFDIDRKLNDFYLSEKVLSHSQMSLKLAQTGVSLAKEHFIQGVTDWDNVLASQKKMFLAEKRYLETKIQYLKQWSLLQTQLGRFGDFGKETKNEEFN